MMETTGIFKFHLGYNHSYTIGKGEITVYAKTYDEAKEKAKKAIPDPTTTGYPDRWSFYLKSVVEVPPLGVRQVDQNNNEETGK